MTQRLWGHAWEIWAGLVLITFGLLEDAAYRRERHPTLSRRLKKVMGRFALMICVAVGTAGGVALGVHLVRLKDELAELARTEGKTHV